MKWFVLFAVSVAALGCSSGSQSSGEPKPLPSKRIPLKSQRQPGTPAPDQKPAP